MSSLKPKRREEEEEEEEEEHRCTAKEENNSSSFFLSDVSGAGDMNIGGQREVLIPISVPVTCPFLGKITLLIYVGASSTSHC